LSLLRWFVLLVLVAMAWFVPRFGDSLLLRIERCGKRFAANKQMVVLAIFLAAIVARVALLWAMPVPLPRIHDEFSYLLQADTFLHGRLTNPPHPMSLFLDTFHVLFRPTYQSMYPPAQGTVLALGQLLGHPWIGVLLSMAAMCAAMTWMLQGWLPPNWALIGGVIVLLRIHLFSYWSESYWGGAAAATGGALVLGAYRRITHRQQPRDAVLMGIGIGLLANSRPLEGFIFCIPIVTAFFIWLFSKRRPAPGIAGRRVLLPLAAVLAVTAVFMGYYNWRVTENTFVFPRALYQHERLNLPVFMWEAPQPPLHYSNPQFERFYNVIERKLYLSSWTRLSWEKVIDWWRFFMGSFLWLPMLALPWVIGDCRTRLPLVQFLWCALGLLAVRYFFPHYAAPLATAFLILLIQAMRHLRRWEFRCRPIGIFLTRLVMVLLLVRATQLTTEAYRHPTVRWNVYRARVMNQLEATPGKHLVIVRYTTDHVVDNEWVYNRAEIDDSKIVWAREIPGQDMAPLLDYFRDREVWLLEADRRIPQLEKYRSTQQAASLVANIRRRASDVNPTHEFRTSPLPATSTVGEIDGWRNQR
jgi:hypothetical protein